MTLIIHNSLVTSSNLVRPISWCYMLDFKDRDPFVLKTQDGHKINLEDQCYHCHGNGRKEEDICVYCSGKGFTLNDNGSTILKLIMINLRKSKSSNYLEDNNGSF